MGAVLYTCKVIEKKKNSHKTSHSVRAAVLENRKAGILRTSLYHLTGKMSSLPKPPLKNIMGAWTKKHFWIATAVSIVTAIYTHYHYAAVDRVIADYEATVDRDERWARLTKHGVFRYKEVLEEDE